MARGTIKLIRHTNSNIPILFDIPGTKTRLQELEKPIKVKKIQNLTHN